MNFIDDKNYSYAETAQHQELHENATQATFSDEDFEVEAEVLEEHLNLLPGACSCSGCSSCSSSSSCII